MPNIRTRARNRPSGPKQMPLHKFNSFARLRIIIETSDLRFYLDADTIGGHFYMNRSERTCSDNL